MVKIEQASLADDPKIFFALIDKLLAELTGESGEFTAIDTERVYNAMMESADKFTIFLAQNEENKAVGVITLVESFAIYAGGHYDIINELYVMPEYRSKGVGKQLLVAVKNIAQKRGWMRIDVTAPEDKKWERTVQFYEREGFVFTGPKMRYLLP